MSLMLGKAYSIWKHKINSLHAFQRDVYFQEFEHVPCYILKTMVSAVILIPIMNQLDCIVVSHYSDQMRNITGTGKGFTIAESLRFWMACNTAISLSWSYTLLLLILVR